MTRIKAECGLVGAHPRKKWRRGRPDTAPGPDLLNRDFTAARSDQRWVADITEFRCRDGKLHLAGIKDLHDHGWPAGRWAKARPPTSSSNALVMALARWHPDSHRPSRGSPNPVNTHPSSSQPARRLLRQLSDGLDLGGVQARAVAYARALRAVHPLPAPPDPVRLMEVFCSRQAPPSTTKPASGTAPTAQDLRCEQRGLTNNMPCPRSRVSSKRDPAYNLAPGTQNKELENWPKRS